MKNKVISILLALALILTSAVNIFALEENIEDVNAREVLDSNLLDPEKPEEPEEPIEDDEPKIEIPEEEEVEAEEADEPAQKIEEDNQRSDSNDEIEISDEEVLGAVGEPYDIDKINMIAKVVKDGETKYYGVKTYNNQEDHVGQKHFYEIKEEVYNNVKDKCFMRFTRVEGFGDNEQRIELPFKLRYSSLMGSIDDPAFHPQPENEAVFTELYFRHHMAYREGFINIAPYILPDQRDYTYLLQLQKDWTVEKVDGFYTGEAYNWADIKFNCILEGNGYTLSKSDNTPAEDAETTLMKINTGENAGAADFYSLKVIIRDLTIDGSMKGDSKLACMLVYDQTDLTLENVKLTNGKNIENEGGGITLRNNAKLTMDDKCEISNCSSIYGGALRVRGKSIININGSKFSKNSSNVGGAIAVIDDESTVNIKGATFEDNSSTGPGGAIYSNSSMTIDNTTFKNNNADEQGGAIYQTKEKELNIRNSKFEENRSILDGGAIYLRWKAKAEINGSTFNKNISQKNGGAISFEFDNKNESIVSKCSFEDNSSIKGGGIFVGKISKLKVEEAKFKNNSAEHGGAIYTGAYEYADPISKKEAYKNLTVDDKTLFTGNKAGAGLFAPPSNYEDFTNLKFNPNSDVEHEVLTRRSLLNNYDVNYKNPNKLIIYDANGGKFADGTEIKTNIYPIDEVISIIGAPTREGYKFLYWKGSKYNPGDSYTVKDNHTFVAQWEAEEPEPQPEPYDPGYFYDPSPDYLNEKSEPERRDLDVYRWYMEGNENNEFMPKKGITRAEMAQIFARALSYDGYKTYGDYNPYPDVETNKWYYQAIITTTEAGVFKGTDMGTFEPQREITQAELIATISRFQKLINKDGNAFEMKFDHWARPEVQAAYEEKWLELYKDGRANFNADAVISREEVATILNKAFGRPTDKKYIEQILKDENDTEKNLKTFKDIDKDMWSYYEIITAANTYAVKYKDKERTDYEWYNNAIEDDGPSMPVEKIRWYKGLLNNYKYIDHLYQIKFQREMRRY